MTKLPLSFCCTAIARHSSTSCYRMVRNREQAEDLAQEVFLRVYRARDEYVPSAKFTTWLFRIATNLALNSVRDNRHQKLEDLH